jgi:hypothetical protein
MKQSNKGLLLVWTDIPAELDYEFNEWYNREHMRDRILRIDGFIRGRRFVAVAGEPKYLAVYECHSIDVLQSEPYRALVRNPDALSRRFIPVFKNTIKGICDIVADAGEAEGTAIAMLPMVRAPSHDSAALRQWMSQSLLPKLMGEHGIVAARYIEKNPVALAAGTAEHLRPTDQYIDALLMIEAVSETDLAGALAHVKAGEFCAQGAELEGAARRLNLIYTQHVPPAGAR